MDSIKEKYNLSLLRKKTLIMNQRYFSDDKRIANIQKGAFDEYPYKVEFASSDRIAEIIKGKDKKYVLGVALLSDAIGGIYMYDVETAFLLGDFSKGGLTALPIKAKTVEKLVEKIDED